MSEQVRGEKVAIQVADLVVRFFLLVMNQRKLPSSKKMVVSCAIFFSSRPKICANYRSSVADFPALLLDFQASRPTAVAKYG